MIKPLRKRHLMIWTLWAVLLPVGIIAGYLAVPKKITQELLQQKQEADGNKIIATIENKNFKASIIENNAQDSQKMLLIQLSGKGRQEHPSFLLYRVIDSTNSNVDKQELVGRIEGTNPYFFPFTSAAGGKTGNYFKYFLYDIIKKQVVDSLNFN